MCMARKSEIPEKLAAEMTPAVRAFVESLLARIDELESQVKKTPQNSSLPPSTQHPHAKPERVRNGNAVPRRATRNENVPCFPRKTVTKW